MFRTLWNLLRKNKPAMAATGYITIVYDINGDALLIHDSLSSTSGEALRGISLSLQGQQAGRVDDESNEAASSSDSDFEDIFDSDSSPSGLWDSGPDSLGLSMFMD